MTERVCKVKSRPDLNQSSRCAPFLSEAAFLHFLLSIVVNSSLLSIAKFDSDIQVPINLLLSIPRATRTRLFLSIVHDIVIDSCSNGATDYATESWIVQKCRYTLASEFRRKNESRDAENIARTNRYFTLSTLRRGRS